MAVLSNARHEKFAQSIAAGRGTRQAYLDAGYETTPEAADASGARLLGTAKVRERVTELQSVAAAHTVETVEKITRELNEALAMAREQERPDRMVAASLAKAKINGLIIERHVHSFKPDQMTDDDLATIAAGGRAGVASPASDQGKPH